MPVDLHLEEVSIADLHTLRKKLHKLIRFETKVAKKNGIEHETRSIQILNAINEEIHAALTTMYDTRGALEKEGT